MTPVYPWISSRGANYPLLLLIFLLPVFTYAGSSKDYGGDPKCCDHYDYWIKFPKDAEADCAYPDTDDIQVHEGSCDLLAVSKTDKKFTVPGSSNCYKIFRTYGVVNWCEYVDGSDPVVVGRDEDCDGKPGDEDIYVIVKTKYGNDPCAYDKYGYSGYTYEYQHVWYDRDSDPHNYYPAAGTKGKYCDYETNPKGFWKEVTDSNPKDYKYRPDHCEIASVGYWQYTQIIKVTDYDKPLVTFKTPDPFCSYSSDKYQGCPGAVDLSFSVQEDCSPQDVTVKAFFDKNRNGSLDTEVTNLLTGSYPAYSLAGSFPLGKHFIKILADDGCGNVGIAEIPFKVVDCKGPSPICINGLAIKLMPLIPTEDADKDGDIDEGAMTIWASDFIASPAYDCNGPVTYSVNRVGEPVDKYRTGITLTCDDAAVTLVEVHAWDAQWNDDFCITYVQVQSNEGLCPAEVPAADDTDTVVEEAPIEAYTGSGILAGHIQTEYKMPVDGVVVHRMSADTAHQLSNILGEYLFVEETMQSTYLIEPEADNNWMKGITISDLHLLKKYLMGIAELDSPYKMLAADLDASRSITEADLDLLWTLFLYQATELDSTTSWRFVPEAYVFPDTTDPWLEEIPNSILLEDLQAPRNDLNFVAVKMGDLDESISLESTEARSTGIPFVFQLPDLELTPGSTQRLDFIARDLDRIDAYQMSLAFDPDQLEVVRIVDGLVSTKNFGHQDLRSGLIHTAWHRPVDRNRATSPSEVLFSLELRAKTNLQLRDALRITPRGLPAKAIGPGAELYDIALVFETPTSVERTFSVMQNTPNPFQEQTQIRYHLPEAAGVHLRITDVNGRILREIRTEGIAGENVLNLSRNNLVPGVLFYTLTAGEYAVTRKMVVL